MINTAFVFFILITIIPSATPLNFSFPSFSANNDGDIFFERNSTTANGALQLTRNSLDTSTTNSIGRATYIHALPLWDTVSRNLTDFSTNFTFVINSRNRTRYGDGLTFFLAPNGSRIPDNSTRGGSLGLTAEQQRLNSTDNPFVAVEFDTFPNNYDPLYNHVGIDINSMGSVITARWSSNTSIMQGREQEATIRYDSNSMNLSLIVSGLGDDGSFMSQELSYTVDLRDYLPAFATFGFSAATGSASALHSITSWSFSSTLQVNGNETDTGTGIGTGGGSRNTELVVGLAIGGVILLVILGLVIYFFWNKKKGIMNEADDDFDVKLGDEFEQGAGPKKFSYSELASATSNFAEQEKLGEGGFGGVYKGFLKGIDTYVAVKKVSRGSSQGVKEYASEVKIISRLRHKNLVQLIGWCHQKQELLLVYEFMPNASLDHHLFKGKSLLDWGTRFKIANGLASALSYLHEDWEQCVVHRDIKSSNVMLDANLNAKLGDFGLARLVDHEKGSQTTVLAGTMGYMAPECIVTGKASKESDVFSFGVVALEIASGRKPINTKVEQGQIHLVEWAWRLYGLGKILDVADPQLGDEFDSQEMKQLMTVGLWCAHPISELRPSIKQAIRVLNFEAQLPELPARMPVPMYCIPSTDMPLTPYGTILSGSSNTFYDENTSSSKFTASSQ